MTKYNALENELVNELEKINKLFEIYKNIINFYMNFSDKDDYYCINVTSTLIEDDKRKIKIDIKSSKSKEENNFSLPTITLNNSMAIELINLIRNDFIENHYILFATCNPNSRWQEINNSIFSLRIQLPTEDEVNSALETNTFANNTMKKRLHK